MYKITLSLIFAFTFFVAFAQNNKATLDVATQDETTLSFQLETYDFNTVMTPNGEAQVITAADLSAIMKHGAPDLPKYTASILIPDTGQMEVRIISSDYTDIQNVEIAPSKGNFTRDIDPASVPYEYGRDYTADKFYPGNLARLNAPYIMRDYRGQALQLYPFQYNPVTKVLRVYSTIQVSLTLNEEVGVNQLERTSSLETVSKEYNNIYARHFINYNEESRYTPVAEEGNMLIICYDDWTEYMDEFVLWKNTIGRPTEMVTVTDAGGTAAAIKTYVENYYNTNGLTYLLLVGDSDQVPTLSGAGLGGHSDNAYGYISGDDHYQEFFVGRFSAEDPTHVMTQALRSIEYEKGDQLTDGWLNKAMSVASEGGPGDDNEMDYEHLRNIQTDLEAFTYETPFFEHFDGSQGAPDAAGDPTPSDVAASLNTGLGFANYTGHGSDTSWVSSGFSINDVNSLTNDNKLPFIYDVACVNGNFVGQDCFAEAWLRAENGIEPTGAIAIAAATINQNWNPPMIAQDEMTDILVGISTTAPSKRTYAGILVNGMFQMGDESSDWPMLDTWVCFGDPSLYVRTDNTSDMVISHSDVIIIGETSFAVTCDTNDGLATLSINGAIVGSAVVESGVANIPIADLTPGDIVTLAVTGFNKVTYITTVGVIAPEGPYLVVESYENSIDYGQTNDLDMVLKNVGVDMATDVSASISTTDANASITNTTYAYGNIDADTSSAASVGAFSLAIADNVVDQYTIELAIEITDDSDTWNETKFVTVNAPELSVGTMLTIDDAAGNNDGILDPGETADIHIQSSNIGHATITNVIGAIVSANTELTLNSITTTPIDLAIGETQEFIFNITADEATEDGTATSINYTVTGGESNQYSGIENFEIVIGFVPEYCTAGATTATDEFISRVQFNSIDNSSTIGASYTDYTAISTDITQGQDYPITITNGASWNSDQMGCWIDWNYDGDFDDANETFTIDYVHANMTGTGTITVPSDARLGNTRMRLRVLYTGDINPCGDASYGEVEDYTVNVLAYDVSTTDYNTSLINVYPNPNNGVFSLDLSALDTNETVSVSIYNTRGQLIYNHQVATSKLDVNLSEATGIYFLKVMVGNQIMTKKLILN